MNGQLTQLSDSLLSVLGSIPGVRRALRPHAAAQAERLRRHPLVGHAGQLLGAQPQPAGGVGLRADFVIPTGFG